MKGFFNSSPKWVFEIAGVQANTSWMVILNCDVVAILKIKEYLIGACDEYTNTVFSPTVST